MPPTSKRPFRTTLCGLLVLITVASRLVRLETGIAWAGVLKSYAPLPGPVYIGVTGGIWVAAGCAILWGLWRRTRWGRWSLLIGAWLYAIWAWADRILLQAGGSPNWKFDLIWTVLVLGFITAVCLDIGVRKSLGEEAHEREPKDPSSE